MKNKSINMLIVGLLLLALFSVMLIVFLAKAKEDFPKDIKVNADGVTESILSVRELMLNPTESKTYDVDLICAASGAYYITLEYEETKDGGMKPFVNVSVSCDAENVYEGTLADLIDGGTQIKFEGELKESTPLVVSFKYEMPYDVGNEAQGTYADFDIHLSIKKK